ncbi:hypothetical protein EDD36DRAFT_492662 [Exophiala viscosa]|uniref:Uncharacterized protein n=1 Tax=Exophiala viscosa TaxID=2486360 RepID=A0AAN6E2I7_9EURO|nr:hypothetical protein EDD36DRAFT_492662 [Exophiala viscosa]
MASHTRSRSKNSFSIFSFDTIRSLSRAGSRQAARIPSRDDLNGRAESSLSYRCDPHNQPPSASPEPVHTTNNAAESFAQLFPESQENHNGAALPGVVEESVGAATACNRRARRFRPLSWLPFGQHSSRTDFSRSLSVQLPKAASTSTVTRSVISAPVLTSTTNVGVAHAEGVHCGELSGLSFSQSTGVPQSNSQASSELPKNTEVSLHEEPDNQDAQTQQAAVSARSTRDRTQPARSRISQFRNVLRSKVRSIPHKYAERKAQPPMFDAILESTDESVDPVVAEGALRRRRTETLNLYKDKVKELTGNGHVRRKSWNSSKELAGTQEDPPLLGEFTNTRVNDSEQSDNEEFGFGSLTKSFASAVDKLDFQTPVPRNMSFLRSKSSLFLSKKGDSGDANRSEMKRQETTSFAPQPSPPPPIPTRLPPAPLPPGPPPPPAPGRAAQLDLAARKSAPSPVVFSTEQNAYVAAKPVPGYPRGVNPLRMHPPDTMASPPPPPHQENHEGPGTSNISSSQQRPPPSKHGEEEDDSISLDDAPIYSPSLGDLSQYSRDTPPPSTGQRRTVAPRPKAVYVTPTRNGVMDIKSSDEQRAGLLKKSRSALFGRSRTTKPTEISNHLAPSPLFERDVNQKLTTGAEKRVKKSRSLQFAGLFKKESQSSLPAAMSRDMTGPFQPATPSPLRNVTRASRGNDTTRAKGEASPSLFQTRK